MKKLGKVFLVASGKGGVGKSTICANLAACLSARGKKVLILDGDLRLRNLDIYLGLCNEGLFDIQDLYLNNCDVEKAIIKHPVYSGIDFIPGPGKLTVDTCELSGFISEFALEQGKDRYDFVFIDCPSGIDGEISAFMKPDILLLLIANPDAASIRDAEKISISAYGNKIKARLIVNKVIPSLIIKGLAPNIDDVIDRSCVQLIGIIPYDLRITANAPNGILLKSMRKSKSLTAFDNIAARLCGEDIPVIILN